MKVFLSIGTGPGIGFTTAERFAQDGFIVILSARTQEKTRQLSEQLRTKGYQAEAEQVDATDVKAILSLVERVRQKYGNIDVLHYNAAVLRQAALREQSAESFYADTAVNISGALAAAWSVAPVMEEAGAGTILLTGGYFGIEPNPDFLSLSVGKAGIRAIALALFEPLKQKNIHVGTVTVAAYVSPQTREAREIGERFFSLYEQPADKWVPELDYSVTASNE